jgi:hypothetical protein
MAVPAAAPMAGYVAVVKKIAIVLIGAVAAFDVWRAVIDWSQRYGP